MAEYEFVDHLNEYMKGLAKKYIEDSEPENRPAEFKGIKTERLIDLIAEQSTSILRKIKDDAVEAAIERTARLIRYYKRSLTTKHRLSK